MLGYVYNSLKLCKKFENTLILTNPFMTKAAKNNSLQGYYDESNNPATPELVENMPQNMKLIFWDYYHTTSDIYSQKIQQHRQMGCQDPWVASKVVS